MREAILGISRKTTKKCIKNEQENEKKIYKKNTRNEKLNLIKKFHSFIPSVLILRMNFPIYHSKAKEN